VFSVVGCTENWPSGNLTSSHHGFETGLLVNARPEDVSRSWPSVSQGEETQCETHSCRHGDHKARGHTPNTCENSYKYAQKHWII